MLRGMQRRLQRQDGFTLIEMMAVILIIGILVAVATVSIPQFLQDARRSNLRQQLAGLQVAAERFWANSDDAYPVDSNAGHDYANPVLWDAVDSFGKEFNTYFEDAALWQNMESTDYGLEELNGTGGGPVYWGITNQGTVFATDEEADNWNGATFVMTRRGIVQIQDIATVPGP